MNIFTLAKKEKSLYFYFQDTHTSDSILQSYASNLKRIGNISLVFLA